MNDTGLRTLFEEMLEGEPDQAPPVQEDLVRGRRVRLRRRRRRVAGTALVGVAAAAAALIVPVSPASLIEGRQDWAPAGPPDIAGAPVQHPVWQAVEAALPADVHVDEASGTTDTGGLYVTLTRHGHPFGLHIWVQEARLDLDEFRPCSEPTAADFYVQANCSEGYDEDGRWRVMAEAADGRSGVAIIEGGSASVTLQWDRTVSPPPSCEGDTCEAISEDDIEITGNLTTGDAAAIADAAWSVASGYPSADLASGIDLQAMSDQWPAVVQALESALDIGELSPAGPGGVTADIDGQVGSIAGTYTTADGDRVEVLVWQKERLYDPFCVELMCNFLPDQSVSTGSPSSGNAGRPSLGSIFGLGQRAGLEIWVDSSNPGANQGLADATAELENLVPILD